MNRNVVPFSTCMAALIVLLLAVPAAAHPVATNDTSRGDWFAKGPPVDNIGTIARDATGRGEFIWFDKKGDQRIVDPQVPTPASTPTITREADLTKFSVTADTTNISFLARFERYTGISNNPPVELIISIDNDRATGATALPAGVATDVSAAAKWEYTVQTRFSAGIQNPVTATPRIYTSQDGTFTDTGAAQLVSSAAIQGGFVEIQVPWSAIGGQPLPENALRFTVSTYYADHRVPPGQTIASKAIDVISSDPAGTAHELADGKLDSAVELHFNAGGEVFAPLLISEFLPDPLKNPKGEWIEIYNPNSFGVSLAGYKLGDQPYRTGSQGMVLLQLPGADQVLPAGGTVVVANDVATFKADNPTVTLPANRLIDLNTLPSYTSWASGKITLQNQNNGASFKESIVLLDPSDTIVDMVQYAYSSSQAPVTGLDPDNRPILLTGTAVARNTSYDRCPSTQDSNNSGLDFFVHSGTAQDPTTPGVACLNVPGVDLRIAKNAPESVAAALGTKIQYIIPFSNAGRSAAQNVTITDTLPTNVSLSCVHGTTAATIFGAAGTISPASGCPSGAPLAWTIPTLPSGASGVITLTVQFTAAPPQDAQVVNTVGITSTPAESEATMHNNVASQTLITAGPADLGVASTWATVARPAPGREFTYTIAYGNYGEDSAADIVIADQLPPQATFVGQVAQTTSSGASVTFTGAAGNKPTWKVSSLDYLESGTITVVVRLANTATSGAPLQHHLTISSNPPDLSRAGEQPDSEQTALLVGRRLLYLPFVIK